MDSFLADEELVSMRKVATDMCREQLDRAIEALTDARMQLTGLDRVAILIDLYDEEFISKGRARRMGPIDPADFYDLVRDRRLARRKAA